MFLMPGSRAKRRFQDNLPRLTNSISSNVALNNTGTFFDGPSVAQGTRGVWFATGTVTLSDTSGGAFMEAKLWDGTNVIASCGTNTAGASGVSTISLSGFINAPLGNIRISVRDTTSVSGLINANVSTSGKDSTVTVVRVA